MKNLVRRLVLCAAVMLMMCTAAWADVAIDAEHFPDDAFRDYVSKQFDKDGNGQLSSEEASVTRIRVEGANIFSIEGIEYFTSLTELSFYKTSLTTLDVSKNRKLEKLSCNFSQFTTLNVRGCSNLHELYCIGNKLTVLDVSGCSHLWYLYCGNNQLTTLDVSGCSELWELDCYYNQLTTLDVSGCTGLRELDCYNNRLTTLNVSGCSYLEYIDCDNNQLTALDVSGCQRLQTLNCQNNKLASLNVDNIKLWGLNCRYNNLSTLDVSKCPILQELDCSHNKLASLNVNNNIVLSFLIFNGNDALLRPNITTDHNIRVIGCDYYVTDKDGAYQLNISDLIEEYGLPSSLIEKAENYLFVAYALNDADGDGVFVGINPYRSNNFQFLSDYDEDEDGDDTLEIISATGYFSYWDGKRGQKVTLNEADYSPASISTSSGKTIISFPRSVSKKLYRIAFYWISSSEPDVNDLYQGCIYPPSAQSEGMTPSITTASLTEGYTGSPYGSQLTAKGTDPITWTADNLPDGLTLSSAGYISGTPTTAGTFRITVKAANSSGYDTKTLTLTVSETPSGTKPSIATTTLTSGVAGKDYTFQLMASGSTPITWTLKGKLPDGLSMTDSGLITGTPTKKGTKKLTLTATNDSGSDTKKLSLVVNEPPQITTKELKEGTVGKKYTFALKAKGTKPLTWTLEGDLPDGIEFDAAKGKFSGTPTVNGTYTVLVILENEGGSVAETYDLIINTIPPVISTKSLKKGTWGKKYNATIKVSKAAKPVTLTLEGELPEGLTFDSETGQISGTPTETCDERKLTATATNMAGTTEKEYTLTIKGVAPKITTKKLPDAKINEPYSVDIEATGTPEITWNAESLPDGLSITDEGVIEGTPTEEGKYKVKVTATNSTKTAKKNYTLNVLAAPEFVDEDGTLPGGTEGSAYSYTPTVTGSKKITFSITSGSLPKGIKLNASKGTLKGKPKASGTFNFTITASNSVGTASMNFTLEIESKADKNTSSGEEYAVIENNNYLGGNENYAESYIIVAELPEVSVDVAGMYDFSVTLGENAPVGAKLLWLAGSSEPSDDDKIAEFYNELGEEVDAVPESRRLTVSAWLNPERVYKPAIAIIH